MSVVLITNMFPDDHAPHLGTFVRDTLEFFGDRVEVVYPGNSIRDKKLRFYGFLYVAAFPKIVHSDSVVVHYPLFFAPLVAFARLMRKRVILVYHGGEFMSRPGKSGAFLKLRGWIFKANNSMASKIFVPTDFVAVEYFRRWAVKTTVWYSGGIDISCASRNAGERPYAFGYFGRMEPVKGHDCYLDALRSLAKRLDPRSQVECLCVCREYSRADVESVQALRIHYLPPVSQANVLDYLRQCVFVVIPSYAESLCLLALEAASCGTIVIARRLPALEETLGKHAIYFDDDHELPEVMESALEMSFEERGQFVEGIQSRLARFDRRKLKEEISLA